MQEEGGFITLLYGVLNTTTGELQWTSAGHPIPLILNVEGRQVTAIGSNDDGGLPLGILEDADYDSHHSVVPPGSPLVVLTDGLEEAFPFGDREHDQFGVAGISQTLVSTVNATTDEAVQALLDESSQYTRGAGRHDDTSVVVVERASDDWNAQAG